VRAFTHDPPPINTTANLTHLRVPRIKPPPIPRQQRRERRPTTDKRQDIKAREWRRQPIVAPAATIIGGTTHAPLLGVDVCSLFGHEEEGPGEGGEEAGGLLVVMGVLRCDRVMDTRGGVEGHRVRDTAQSINKSDA
jgi:hypothetical protein